VNNDRKKRWVFCGDSLEMRLEEIKAWIIPKF
jgi:hypothetical protein